MNIRVLILFMVATVSVVGVFFMTRSFLTSIQQNAQRNTAQPVAVKKAPTLKIYVAARTLPIGTIVSADDFKAQPWPKEALNDSYILVRNRPINARQSKKPSNAKADNRQASSFAFDGQVVRAEISAGEPLIASALVAPGERGFLAAILKPGMRAATVNLTPVAGVGGFIFPGDRVDIILAQTVDTPGGGRNSVAETVMQNVRVLGVDQSSVAGEGGAKVRRTATLEVTPKMAEKFAMLERLGALSLSLRSLAAPGEESGDAPLDLTTSMTIDSEISRFRNKPEEKKKQRANQIIVRRGNVAVSINTANDNSDLSKDGSDSSADEKTGRR